MKRALAFCQNINLSKTFASEFSSVVKEYIKNENIPSDSKKEIAKAYGVLFFGIQSKRETHYIGKNGDIIYIDKNVSPETAAQDIAQRIVSLQSS